jgi:hypothetical protein
MAPRPDAGLAYDGRLAAGRAVLKLIMLCPISTLQAVLAIVGDGQTLAGWSAGIFKPAIDQILGTLERYATDGRS